MSSLPYVEGSMLVRFTYSCPTCLSCAGPTIGYVAMLAYMYVSMTYICGNIQCLSTVHHGATGIYSRYFSPQIKGPVLSTHSQPLASLPEPSWTFSGMGWVGGIPGATGGVQYTG